MNEWSACPECKKNGTIFKSKSRSLYEQVITYQKIFQYYRCHSCGWRAIGMKNFRIRITFKNVIGYLILLIIVYIITSYFIKTLL